MKNVIFTLSAAVTVAAAQSDIFEATNFNVTEALVKNGFNVSAIPKLSGSDGQTSLRHCSVAVRHSHRLTWRFPKNR